MDWRVQITFAVIALVCTHVCTRAEASGGKQRPTHTSSVAAREATSRCVSCIVNESVFRGHSRFQYEKGCFRYRCVCRCNGTHDCSEKHTENICKDSETVSTESSTSKPEVSETRQNTANKTSTSSHYRGRHRCTSCVVNGKTHPGHAYFTNVDGCTTIRGCICHCNGTWACPKDRAVNTCKEEGGDPTEVRASISLPRETVDKDTAKVDRDRSSGRNRTSAADSNRTPNSTSGNRRTNNRRRPRYRGCQNCTANGTTAKGNSYFELVSGCTKYKYCICYCNGTWNCPERSALPTCKENGDNKNDNSKETKTSQERAGSTCGKCSVKGNMFPGNQYFNMKDGCLEYRNCACYCNGTWTCPDSGARNVCPEREQPGGNISSRCKSCDVKGQVFPGNQYFQYKHGCIEYRNCVCRCNGSWSCPDIWETNTCGDKDISTTQRPATERPVQCRSCVVNGNMYRGNRRFSWTDSCTEYRNCMCHCNGTWSCPTSGDRNRCDEENRIIPNVETTPAADRCGNCQVYGNTYVGNRRFEVKYGCMEFKDCTCHCNSTWVCPENSSANTCETKSEIDAPDVDRTDTTETECKKCFAYETFFKGNDYFDVVNGCMSYKNCVCRCDGSWNCSARHAKNICGGETDYEIGGNRGNHNQGRRTCSPCKAKNKTIEGNSRFELVDGCTEYKYCICRCNGSWECPPQFAKNICTEEESPTLDRCTKCIAKGREIPGNSSFDLKDGCIEFTKCRCNCDGSWDCFAKNRRNICTDAKEREEDRCTPCKSSDGRQHAPNRRFNLIVDECKEFTDCQCFCNGSWSCPGGKDKSKWICSNRCTQCSVEGRIYESDAQFPYKTGCLEYTCTCQCNGSFTCPGSTVINTCSVGVRDNCNKCTVQEKGHPIVEYEGESDFVLSRDCLQFQCRCNCDGSWNCPGDSARNVCRGENVGGCRTCAVSDSEFYQGDTDFSMRKECFEFQCRCNCDGSWSCPAEKARNICIGENPKACKVCTLRDGTIHQGNINFEMRKGCLIYKCKCNCDGSWNCPGKEARDVCRREIPGGCKSCVVSETEYYQSGTSFPMTRNCNDFMCMCKCDGSYSCAFEARSSSCSNLPDKAVETSIPQKCSKCKVSETEYFNGNTAFTLVRGCRQYSCDCNCDGSWTCPSNRAVDVCDYQSCISCKVGADEYPGNSTFLFTRRCTQFNCQCQCGGVWTCDYRNPKNICDNKERRNFRERTHTVTHPIKNNRNCKKCYIDDKLFEPHQKFNVTRGCQQYNRCVCNCKGGWQCAEEINVCERKHLYDRKRSINNENKISSSAWIYADGVNRSHIATTDGKTGGGYKQIKIDTNYVPTYSTLGWEQNKHRRIGRLDRHTATSVENVASRGTRDGTRDCLPCQADDRSYPPGATFDKRRGCVIYKCLCLCSGSYRCRLVQDNQCSPHEKQNSCSNCLYNGMVFPGNMGFTVRDVCQEKECKCSCDGVHACSKPKPIPGCKRGTGHPVQTPHLPVAPGMTPVRMNYLTSSGRPVYFSNCKNCNGQNGRAVYYMPVHPASGGVGNVPIRSGIEQAGHGQGCDQCMVNSQLRPGNSTFAFTKDCIEFDCYCGCDGAWKCAGRMSPACTSGVGPKDGYAPDTISHKQGCKNCEVEGTRYPSNSRFSLRKGCSEYKCTCNCDGSWVCPKQVPTNLCPPETNTPRGRYIDPLYARESRYIADQAPEGSIKVKVFDHKGEQNIKVGGTHCLECEVQGVTYPGKSTFLLREGCVQATCTCNCNGTRSCPEKYNVDICKWERIHKLKNNGGECDTCTMAGKTFNGGKHFQLTSDCFQYNCKCHCNGSHFCPPEEIKDICQQREQVPNDYRSGRGQTARQTTRQILINPDDAIRPLTNKQTGCKKCKIDDYTIKSMGTFIRSVGCYEAVCHCQCSGVAKCPPSSTVNVCELPDKMPIQQRKGCRVGQNIYYTRVFAHVKKCIERTCICHDDGTWNCIKSAGNRRVC